MATGVREAVETLRWAVTATSGKTSFRSCAWANWAAPVLQAIPDTATASNLRAGRTCFAFMKDFLLGFPVGEPCRLHPLSSMMATKLALWDAAGSLAGSHHRK